LPTLESGQFFPLWLQDAATGQVHELVYVTGVSGATLTVERAQEGTTAQNWNIGDLAYSNGSSGTFAPITAVHSPVVSETLPTANKMVVIPGTLTADIALTLPASPVVGQEYTIFGSGASYSVTVQTDVTSGSPYIGLPDGSTVYSWVIPASASLAGIVCTWDGTNWRGRTFGTTVVSDATADNEAVALGQLTNGSISPTFGTTVVSNASANNEAVALGQVLAVSPAYNQHDFTPASGGTYTISNSFTAPCNGYILAASTINLGNGSQPVSCTNSISINGTKYGTDDTIGPMTNWGAAAVSSGTACTVTSTYTAGSSTSSFSSVSQTVMSIFIPNP
jgi:hypothetical protein